MKRWLVLLVSISLLLQVILPACGGGDENEETPTASPTFTVTSTPSPTGVTPTSTPVSTEPIKIGAINSWSGAAAISGLSLNDPVIKLVEKQVKDEGGILGGREVSVVRYDNRASVAEAQAGVTKLYYDDKVSAITAGGVSGAEFNAVADKCEELKVFYSALAHVEDLAKYNFTVDSTVQREQQRELSIQFINDVLKPETAAFFGTDDAQAHSNMQGAKEGLEAAGTKTVYMEYCPITTTDFSPYLSKIKYEKPDLLYLYSGSNEFYITVAKQIMELGGWGDIKVFTQASGESAAKQPGAQGWYLNAYWDLSLNNPGAVKFLNDFRAMYNRDPNTNQVLYYNSTWTAIYAIKLAGTDTDRVAIAEAARSGKLEWDTPMGRAHFTPDGNSGLNCLIKQIVDSKTVVVPFP